MRRVVVVGAGFCGLNAVLALQEPLRTRSHAELVLVDRSPHFAFTPLLGGVAANRYPAHRAATPLRELVDPDVVRLVTDEVVGLDVSRQVLLLRDEGELHYDSLALAPGTVATRPPVEDDTVIHDVRSVESALALQNALAADGGRVLIVGGGCVGVELAGTLAEAADDLALEVVLLESEARLVSGLDQSIASEAFRALNSLGVDVRLGHRVASIASNTAHVEDGPGVDETELEADHIVWCGGVEAPAFLAACGLPIGVGGRVKVGPTLRVPNMGEVYVAGDAAAPRTPDGEPTPQRIETALQQARVLADNLLAGSTGRMRETWTWEGGTEVLNIGGGHFAAWVRGRALRGTLAAGVWHAALATMAPSLGHRVALAAEAGGSVLRGATRWLQNRRQRS